MSALCDDGNVATGLFGFSGDLLGVLFVFFTGVDTCKTAGDLGGEEDTLPHGTSDRMGGVSGFWVTSKELLLSLAGVGAGALPFAGELCAGAGALSRPAAACVTAICSASDTKSLPLHMRKGEG